MRVDFYQLARDPAEAVVAAVAQRALAAGERLLVVSADAAQLDRIGAALWTRLPESFLAHGRAGGGDDARQPILLAPDLARANRAAYCAFADGAWRDADPPFARVFHLFDDATLPAARACWRDLGAREGIDRRFWKQDERGRWVEGP